MKQKNNAMSETCFESLAYCCGLEKECPSRDKAIKRLGLAKEDFQKIKDKTTKMFLEASKK